MTTHHDEFAFQQVMDINGRMAVSGGLTKREYFAAMAMQGILSGSAMSAMLDPLALCDNSVNIADWLIAALNKEAS